jgi:hypothetical protein
MFGSKPILIVGAVVGLCGCATSESVRQAAIANCLQVGISENDPQFPICARSYGLQQQDAALNQNFKNEYDMKLRDSRLRRREDVFR